MQERMYMFRKKIQAAFGSFQYRRPTQPSPTFSARTMRSAQSRTHSHGLWKLRGTLHTHSHVPIVRQVRQVRQVRHSLPAVSALHNMLCQPTEHTALCFGNSGAHCTHTAKCHKSYRAYKAYRAYSGIARTLCIAQCALPAGGNALCFFWRTHSTWSTGGNLTFPPVYPLFARVL